VTNSTILNMERAGRLPLTPLLMGQSRRRLYTGDMIGTVAKAMKKVEKASSEDKTTSFVLKDLVLVEWTQQKVMGAKVLGAVESQKGRHG
jgi:hypothetical protein